MLDVVIFKKNVISDLRVKEQDSEIRFRRMKQIEIII